MLLGLRLTGKEGPKDPTKNCGPTVTPTFPYLGMACARATPHGVRREWWEGKCESPPAGCKLLRTPDSNYPVELDYSSSSDQAFAPTEMGNAKDPPARKSIVVYDILSITTI